MPNTRYLRTVFFVSDGTGITAETFGKSIMAQFDIPVRYVRLPFIDSLEKARKVVEQINTVAQNEGVRPSSPRWSTWTWCTSSTPTRTP